MSYIVAEQMGKSFGSGAAAVHAVRDLNFRIAPGEFVAIMGPSGAGKSTLLAMLGAMNAPTTGRLQVDGIDVYALSPDQLADFRREYLGFVFQSFHLVPYLAVIENVMLPLAVGRQSSREKRRLAEEALAQVGLAGPAKEKNRIFTRYISLRNVNNKFGKQLFYLLNPEEFKKDSALYVQDSLAIAEEIADVQELQESWAGLETLLLEDQDTTGFYQDSVKVADMLVAKLKDSLAYVNRDTIFSKVRKPQPQDSLLVAQFDSMLTNRVFDPNAKQILEMKKRERESLTNQLVASLPDTLRFKNNPPKLPTISEDSLKTLLAKNQLDLVLRSAEEPVSIDRSGGG